MHVCQLFLLISAVTFPESVLPFENFAFVSVLNSNDFLIPAKVLAHQLKTLNDRIPYIILVTEDISDFSIEMLKEQGVDVREDLKIDTPYLATHRAKKFQYTKIHYWEMIEYDAIVHLDLDVLPVKDISSLFYCGDFCASFRHSDLFNSGVFVLRPNKTIFMDMKEKVTDSYSYDGGDQGFLNTYFSDLKYMPMYDPDNVTHSQFNSSMKRLSAVFNYDIGMYYLNGGISWVDPKIIHYTMGPTKPWFWWTYPVFDLNWTWYEARKQTEYIYSDVSTTTISLALFHLIFLALLISLKKIFEHFAGSKLQLNKRHWCENLSVSNLIYISSVIFCLRLVPSSAHPIPAWMYFTCNTAWMTSIIASCYIKIRSGTNCSFSASAGCIFSVLSINLFSWIVLYFISSFGSRAIVVIFIFPIQHLIISYYIGRIMFDVTWAQKHKYHRLPIESDFNRSPD